MKRKLLVEKNGQYFMTYSNLEIALHNQEDYYQNLQLNQSLHLQYYGFINMDNLEPFLNLNTIFLNNNLLTQISGIKHLSSKLMTLVLNNNKINSLKGLEELFNLHTLDLSNNLIQKIQMSQIASLSSLSILNLSKNKLQNLESIINLQKLQNSLTCLNISFNEQFQSTEILYSEILQKLKKVTVLSINGTKFSRSIPSYRKETIFQLTSLLYLDDRPVTTDERIISQAWKKGGKQSQNEARQNIRNKNEKKSFQIWSEIQQRNFAIEKKREKVLQKLTKQSIKFLQKIEKIQNSVQQWQQLQLEQKQIILLEKSDHKQYIEYLKQNLHHYDLDVELNGKKQLPTSFIEKITEDIIYIYHVEQEQLPIIKQKYYSQECRQLKAVNYKSLLQNNNIQEQLLMDVYQLAKGNYRKMVALLNIQLYQINSTNNRPIFRINQEQLQEEMRKITSKQTKMTDQLDQLD